MDEDVTHGDNLAPRHIRSTVTTRFTDPRGGFADLLDGIHEHSDEHRVTVEVAARTLLDEQRDVTGGIEHVLDAEPVVERKLLGITRHGAVVRCEGLPRGNSARDRSVCGDRLRGR